MSEVVIDIRTVGIESVKQATDQIAGMGRVSEGLTGKLDEVNQKIIRQAQAAQKLKATQALLNKAVKDGTIDRMEAVRAMREAHRVAREHVLTDKEAVRVAKDRAKAEKKKSDEIERLRRKHDAAYRVQQEQNKLIQEYNLLLSQGHLTLEEHAHLVDRATKEVKEFNAALVKGGNQFGRFDQNAYKSAQTLKRRFNQGVQQAGYQVGDFFVQIQSGTDILVALGQQGSQLALVFGKHGPMIGAFLAIGTAMATLIIQTLEATSTIKEFDDVIDDLGDSSSKLESLYDMMIAKPEEVAAKHKLAREELLEYIRIQAEYEKKQAEKAITTGVTAEAARPLVQTPLGFTSTMSDPALQKKLGVSGEDVFSIYGYAISRDLSNRQRGLFDEYRKFAGELKAAETEGPEAQLEVLQNLLGVVDELGVEAPDALQEFASKLSAVIEKGSEAAKTLERVNAELNRQNLITPEFEVALDDLAAGRIDIEDLLPPPDPEIRKAEIEAEEALAKIAQKNRERAHLELVKANEAYEKSVLDTEERLLQGRIQADDTYYKNRFQAEDEYMAKSFDTAESRAAVDEYLAEEAEAALEMRARAEKALFDENDRYAKQQERERQAAAKKRIQDAEAAQRAAQRAVDTLSKYGQGLDVSIAQMKAEIQALKDGKDAETAAFIAGEKAKVTAMFEVAKAAAIEAGEIVKLAEITLTFLEAMDKIEEAGALATTLREIKSGMSGGGGGKREDPLAELRERIKLDTELLGKTKERQEVEQAIANSTVEYSKEAVDSVVAQLQAYNQLVEKQQEVQGLYDTAQSALEDGFMSIIDGTKSVEDAFKDMARSIISELYKVLVVQKMVGSFDASTGASSGIMGFLGNLKIFDGGGYTGSGSRSGGLDGRGGYLAMVHPRETVIDHTKAGSPVGENITVVQNFSFQANGDDSVKRIIAQAAPSIANMAKQSVMDARRRGGVMKSTFG